mmetsp:Transcript_2382/g.5110  ORF Transcript_2382/g.5110 Transcript_2382/m.5110 type:complete len:143 (-) Transcript_2382:8-436(-)
MSILVRYHRRRLSRIHLQQQFHQLDRRAQKLLQQHPKVLSWQRSDRGFEDSAGKKDHGKSYKMKNIMACCKPYYIPPNSDSRFMSIVCITENTPHIIIRPLQISFKFLFYDSLESAVLRRACNGILHEIDSILFRTMTLIFV